MHVSFFFGITISGFLDPLRPLRGQGMTGDDVPDGQPNGLNNFMRGFFGGRMHGNLSLLDPSKYPSKSCKTLIKGPFGLVRGWGFWYKTSIHFSL